MPMYLSDTQSVQVNELPARITNKLTEYAESHQIDLRNVRCA